MRVIAIGRTEFLYNSILKLDNNGHDIILLLTCKESPGYKIVANDFKLLAEKLNIDFLETENINSPDIIKKIKESNPDIGISVNWRTIIGQEFIDSFPNGIINAHAGDLPRYRGNAVPNWAILCGEDKIVLTLHLMTVELDAGPIVLQKEMPISDKTYISEVYDFISKNCPEMFLEAVNGYANNSIKLQHQSKDPSVSLRCYPRIPKDGEIDWNRPGIELDRLIRAVSEPFSGAYTFLNSEKLIVWKAHYESPPFPFVGTPGQIAERRPKTGDVAVITGENFLVLEEVETKSKGRKKATDIIKTIRTRLGMDVTGEIQKIKEKLEKMKKS